MSKPKSTVIPASRWVLATVTIISGAAVAFTQWIHPLQEQNRLATARLAELRGSVSRARATVKEVQTMETEWGRARIQFHQNYGEQPHGSSMVWLPERLTQYFKRSGFPGCKTYFNTSIAAPTLPGHEQAYWGVSVPLNGASDSLARALSAVAELEGADSRLRVVSVTVNPNPEGTRGFVVGVTVGALVKAETAGS